MEHPDPSSPREDQNDSASSHTLKVIICLLLGTAVFQSIFNYMSGNIGDFENVALPPKVLEEPQTRNPVMTIDATAKEEWTLVEFATGKTHRIADLETERAKLGSINWDLGFQRTKIISNSGVTNSSGNAGIINLGPVDFDAVEEAPETGYAQDEKKWSKVTNAAIGDWYIYRTRTHNIESKKNVYIVRTAGKRYLKMRILNYYCKHKEADCITVMCDRNEAACFTVEYLLSSAEDRRFMPVAETPPPAAKTS